MIAKNNKVTALLNLGRNEDALEIIEEVLLLPNLNSKERMILVSQRKIILKNMKKINVNNDGNIEKKVPNLSANENKEKSITCSLLTRLYCSDINIEELEQENINFFDKVILSAAYYEKHNKSQGIQYINKRKQEVEEENQIKVLNMLKERLISKKTMVDWGFYLKILDCVIDWDLAIQIEKSSQKSKVEGKITAVKRNSIVKAPVKKETCKSSKMIVVEGKKQSRVTGKSSYVPKVKNVQEKVILIKDIFQNEIMIMGSHVYVGMQSQDIERCKRAMKAWDVLESISNKPITDINALNQMIDLTYRLQYDPIFMKPLTEEKVAMRIKQYK